MASKTNCTINGIKYFRIRIKTGEKVNGKGKTVPIYKNFHGKNQTDAERLVKEWEEKRKLGLNTDKEYFSSLVRYYIYEVFMQGNHAPGTKNRYEGVYRNYIEKSDLCTYLMSDINSKIVQNYFNTLKKSKTDSQIDTAVKVLTLFFKYAEAEGYCRNPLPNVAIKKHEPVKKEIVVFDKKDVKKIIESKKDTRHSTYRFMYLLSLGTGLRQGELIGLKWADVKDGKIKVMRQVIQDTDKKRKIDNTKSGTSVRYVPIPKGLLQELEHYKSTHNAKKDDLVFTTESGRIIDKSNLRISYKRFLNSIDVEFKEFHTLRRTYCTMLCEAGVPLQVASKLMGHSSVQVTAKYYTFVSDKEKDSAVSKLDKFF